MKTRPLSRRSRHEERRSFFGSWWSRAASRIGRRLHVETLEERRVLATFVNPAAINFPAAGGPGAATPYPSNINVVVSPAVTATVLDVDVRLNSLTHTEPADLDILLVGPTSQDVYLMGNAGGTTAATSAVVTFDDEAAGFIVDPLVTGTYRPTVNGTRPFPPPAPAPSGNTTLGLFDSLNPSGLWSLYAVDSVALDTGNISGGWTLTLQMGGNVVIAPVADGAADTIAVTVTATNLQVNINGGTVEFDEPLVGILSFTINGSTDNDTITVTGGNNLMAIPWVMTGGGGATNSVTIDGLHIAGVGGSDALNISGFSTTSINNSNLSNNPGGEGIDLTTVGVVSLANVTADTNGANGLEVDNATSVTISGATGNSFDNNVTSGMQLTNAGTVSVTNATANDNTVHGIHVINGGAVALNTVTANGNDPGVFVNVAASFSDTDGTFNNNNDHGIQLIDIAGDVTLIRTTANDNDADAAGGGDGLNATDGGDGNPFAIGGNLIVRGVEMTGSALGAQRRGVFVDVLNTTSTVTFANSVGVVQSNNISGNSEEGVLIGDGGTTATFTDGAYSNNGLAGLFDGITLLGFTGAVTMSGVTVNENTSDGIQVGGAASFADTDGEYSTNAQHGLNLIGITGNVTLTRTIADDNVADGAHITSGGVNATFTDGSYSDNGEDGIDLDGFSGVVTLDGINASDNGELGFEISNVTNGGGTGTVTLTDLILLGNNGGGGAAGGDLNTIDIVNYTTDTTGTGIDDELTVNQVFIERTSPAQQQITYITVTDMHLFTQDGDDTITVQSTGASGITTTDAGAGDDVTSIPQGDTLSANNQFQGGAGNDTFNLTVDTDFGALSLFPIESVRFDGNAPAANSDNRDVLNFLDRDDIGPQARNLIFDYITGASGDLDILSGANGFAVPVNVRTLETLSYTGGVNGTGAIILNNDDITIRGTPGADDITVVPTSNVAALVFLNGDPWHGPADGDYLAALPGVAGGGNGPDLNLRGIDPTSTIHVEGGGVVFTEDFDGVVAPALPAGWSSVSLDGAESWVTQTTTFDTPPNAAFVDNVATVSDTALVAPQLFISTATSQLSFRNSFDTEANFDGGVLEISIGGGAFADIVTAGGSFVSGGYNGTISNAFGNPLAGRQAWSGNSAGFISTVVNLPAAASGQFIQLRWRMGTDTSVSDVGWAIDTLQVLDGANENDQLIVYAPSEQPVVDPSTTDDLFGYGAGVVVPGFGVEEAYDRITITDTLVSIVNTVDGQLLRVSLDPTSGFEQANGVGFGLIVNAGFDAVPGLDDPLCGDGVDSLADDIFVTPSFILPILANGGDPDATFTPEGDKANLGGVFEAIDVFSDKGVPPAVTFVLHPTGGGPAPFGVGFSSIECFGAFSATTVNLIGDNNDPDVDQTDNFEVVGQDTDSGNPDGDADGTNEFVLRINGSFDIPFANVEFLNVWGYDQVVGAGATLGDVPATPDGTLSPGGQDINVDTLELTAYADNADLGGHPPRGWGIDVFFDEGLPNQEDGFQEDLIIYHTSLGLGGGGSVSEDVVIQPSGPDNGEIRVTNQVDGSIIVVIQYVANTDIIVLDDDGSLSDHDSLTLNGTNPNTPQTSGNDRFTADFTAAGDVANPMVIVEDPTNATPILYRLRTFDGFSTINLAGLAGNDEFLLRNRAGLTVNIDGGDPVGPLGTADRLGVSVPTDAFYNTGAQPSTANITAPGVGPVNVRGLESVAFSSETAGSDLAINGTHAPDAFQITTVGIPGVPAVLFNSQHQVFFNALNTNFTDLSVQGAGGDDTYEITTPLVGVAITAAAGSGIDRVDVFTPIGPDTATFTPINDQTATLSITGFGSILLSNVETATYDGSTAANDSLTLAGTPVDDLTLVSPAAGGTGSFISNNSPAFHFRQFGTLTVNGGAGGQDIVQIDGTLANDAFTAAAAAITLGATVNIGAGIELVHVNGLAGNDNINLTGYAATPVFVHGNDGNDTILGGTLADTLSGDDGNDTIDGNAGADQMFGNAGSDLFIWDPGDGSDLVEGGANESDIMRFNGAAAAEIFALTAVGTRVLLTRSVGAISMDIAGVEQVDINALGGIDSLTVNDLYPTDVRVVNLNLGGADAVADTILVNGRNVSDVVNLSNNAGVLDLIGLRYDVHVQGAAAAEGDNFTFHGRNGNDNIVSPLDASLTALFAVANFTLTGGDGDDYVAGYGTLNGDDPANPAATGRDTLVGGSEPQTITGGPDNDSIFGGGGADLLQGNDGEDTFVPGFDLALDSIDGGAGFDTILVQGTSGNDRIDARQDAIGQVRYDVRGINGGTGVIPSPGTETDVIVPGSVEELKIVAGSGDDIIRVTQSDTLIAPVDLTIFSLRFTVEGGPPGASDRLTVTDDGLGDTTIHRVGGIPGNGSYQIGALAPVVYSDIEFASLNPINAITGGTGTDGLGRLFVFKHDPFEENNDRLNATFLGSDTAINIDPVIDPGPDPEFGLPGDEDWYRVVALANGDLDVRVFFRQQGLLANGRAGLPGNGDLNIAIADAAGNFLATSSSVTDDERVRIPAVAGQTYFVRVLGALGAINVYNLSVINTPAAVPFDLELDDRIVGHLPAEGVAVTAGISPTSFNSNLEVQFPGQFPDDFFNGKVVSFKFGTTTVGLRGEEAVVLDYVGATGVFTLAFPLSATPAAGDTFQVESVDTGRNSTDNITRDNTPTIFLRVPNVINNVGIAALDDVPFNGAAPGNPPDGTPIPINFVSSLTLDVPGVLSGFRVPIFVVENGTSDQGPPNNVLAGYAQPVDPVNRPGVFSFTFGSLGSFITSLTPDSSYFLSARLEMIDGAQPQQAQGYGDYAQSLEIVVDTTIPPIAFGDPGVVGDGLTADSDSFVIPNLETLFDQVTNDLTPTFWGRAEADATVRLFGDSFRDLNGNGVFDFVDVNGNDVFDAGDIAIDTLPNGIFDPNLDVFIGQTTAIPLDGNQQEPNGFWAVESVINFNDPRFFINIGGARTVFAIAEDVAGNVNDNANPIELDIFIDVQGPQITDVEINNLGNTYQLFDPKPSTSGPTPLVNSLVISVRDLPPRLLPIFDSPAFKEDIANNPGHYLVRGDYNGIIPILDIIPVLDPVVNNQPATGTITIVFRLPGGDGVFNTFDDIGTPLPDDRFTLIIDDTGIIDLAGNLLDGESNADEPHQQGAFPPILGVDGVPTGDGIPGGDFIARFTVDSRAEVGVWAGGSAWIDTNGNDHFDPNNLDFTNRDITYMLGLTSDDLFAGNFATLPVGAAPFADGFDKLAAYGRYNGAFRWLVDTDNDGIPNIEQVDPAQVNGLPIAGNFGPFAGDEVALFTGTTWRFDTNHNFQVDNSLAWPTPGYPVVGDFDGDGLEDLGTWTDDVFSIDLSSIGAGGVALPGNPGINGTIDKTFRFGFIGAGERPVARDMNMDGMDDLGLFVPARDGVPPTEGAEWYFLISGMVANNTPNQPGNNPAPGQLIGPTITGGNYPVAANGPGNFLSEATYGFVPGTYARGRIVDDPLLAGPGNIVRLDITPFGNDRYIQFGDTFAVPILGNFDPPATITGTIGENQIDPSDRDPLDVNADGDISPLDALIVFNHLNNGGSSVAPAVTAEGPYLDVSGDLSISPLDALIVINYLNNLPPVGEGEAEGEAADAVFGDYNPYASAADALLSLLAGEAETPRKKK